MSSFAAMTKKELTQLELKDCCVKAELAALIRMNGTMTFGSGLLTLTYYGKCSDCQADLYINQKRLQ